MIEKLAATMPVEKVAEQAIEKTPQSFLANLERSVDVPKPETQKAIDNIENWWKTINGEIPDKYGISPEKRFGQTPISNVEWDGPRGDSTLRPTKEEDVRALKKHGVDEIKYKDGFPDFSPVTEFEYTLPKDKQKSSDADQFTECTDVLATAIKDNPELAEKFDDDQREAIEAGETPSGYTWHHGVEPGKMQLVPTRIHQVCTHYGGRSIWGGGSEYR